MIEALLVIIKIGIITIGFMMLIYEVFKAYINISKWIIKTFIL